MPTGIYGDKHDMHIDGRRMCFGDILQWNGLRELLGELSGMLEQY